MTQKKRGPTKTQKAVLEKCRQVVGQLADQFNDVHVTIGVRNPKKTPKDPLV